MLEATQISFRRLAMADLALMHRWLNADFVMQWYDKRPQTYAEVVEKYTTRIEGRAPTDSYLILYADTPIGYIQIYMIRDYPDYSRYIQVDAGAAGVDLFIGEADYIHRGLGAPILVKFLSEFVFGCGDATSCVIGPEPKNEAAIRAYTKAGFKYLKTVQLPDEAEPEYLMVISPEVATGR